MSHDHRAHGHDAVAAFVSKEIGAEEFRGRFRRWADCDGAGHDDRVLVSICALCDKYARALPSGEGYRISEEQFRCEIQSLAAQALADRPLP